MLDPRPPYLLQIHSRPPPTIPPSTWEEWYTQHHLPILFQLPPSSSSSSSLSSASLALQSAALYRATSHLVRSDGIEGTLESLSLQRIRSPSSPPTHEPSSEGTSAEEEEEGKGKGKYLGLYRMERKGLREREEWQESLRIPPPSEAGLGEVVGAGRVADEVAEMEMRDLEVVDWVGEGNGDRADLPPYLIACEITGAHVGSWLRPQHIEAVSSQLQGYQRTLVYRPVESSPSPPSAASEHVAKGGVGAHHRTAAVKSSTASAAVSTHSPLAMSVMGVDEEGDREESRDSMAEKALGKEEGKERTDAVIFYHELSHLRLGSPPSSPPSSPPVSSSSGTSSRDHDVLLESIREELEAIEGSEGYDFSLRCWELIAGEALGRRAGES